MPRAPVLASVGRGDFDELAARAAALLVNKQVDVQVGGVLVQLRDEHALRIAR